MSTTEAISNNNHYIIHLSLFPYLIIISLFLVLITLMLFILSFALFLYIQCIHQSIKQELVWIRQHRKWPEQPAIRPPLYYRKRRDRDHWHWHLPYLRFKLVIKSLNTSMNIFIYQLQSYSAKPALPAVKPSFSAKLSPMAFFRQDLH